MIKILWIFILLILTIYIGIYFQHDPGYVLIVHDDWSIEMTLFTATLSLIIIFSILHIILVFKNWLCYIPRNCKEWYKNYKMRQINKLTANGLIAFNEGKWKLAQKDLLKSINDNDTPLINYLISANAAQENGEIDKRDQYLNQAQVSVPNAKTAILLTKAQLQILNKQLEPALITINQIITMHPHQIYALKLLTQIYKEMHEWSKLIALIPSLKKYNVFNNTQLHEIEHQAYLNQLQKCINQKLYNQLDNLINILPKNLKQESDFVVEIAKYYIQISNYIDAESILRNTLKKQDSANLIDLYGLIPMKLAKLTFIESLVNKSKHKAKIYLCLSHLNASAKIWGQALYYVNKSIAQEKNADAFIMLAKLREQDNDYIGACEAYKEYAKEI